MGRPGRRAQALCALAALLSMRAVSASAQVTVAGAVIRARVVDQAGRPVPDAISGLVGTLYQTASDSNGQFIIRDIPVGRHRLVIRHVGFVPLSLNADITGPDTIDTQLVLSPALTTLDTVHSVSSGSEPMRLNGFDARRKLGIGHFLTDSELVRSRGSVISTVLRTRVPRAEFISRKKCGGKSLASKVGASITSSGRVGDCGLPDACYFQVFVDGVRIYAYNNKSADPPDIDAFALDQLAGIEVYEGAGQTPPRFQSTGSPCGTIVLWLRR